MTYDLHCVIYMTLNRCAGTCTSQSKLIINILSVSLRQRGLESEFFLLLMDQSWLFSNAEYGAEQMVGQI